MSLADQKTCECGCGTPTPIAKLSNRRLGHIAGQPIRFVVGHNLRVKSSEHVNRIAAALYRGTDACYSSIHTWWNHHNPTTGRCEDCGSTTKKTEWANLDHQYDRDRPDDWRELCRSCHRKRDFAAGYYDEARGSIEIARAARNAQQRAASHCKRGHEFTDENTYRDRKGHRACRTCRLDASRRHRAKRGAASCR